MGNVFGVVLNEIEVRFGWFGRGGGVIFFVCGHVPIDVGRAASDCGLWTGGRGLRSVGRRDADLRACNGRCCDREDDHCEKSFHGRWLRSGA